MIHLFEKRIKVTLIDDVTGEVMSRRKIALGELPDSFLESTTLDLGRESWSVVQAEPPFKRLYTESGALTLRLRPIERMDSGKLLYPVPTIADDLADSRGAKADGGEVLLSEDDWRQIELVSRGLTAEVLQEFDDIRAIRKDARQGSGFNRIHVRRRIPDPLAGSALTLADLEELFGAASSALRFRDRGHRISGGFRYDLGGDWMLYGTAAGKRPRVLALAPSDDTCTAPAPQLSEALSELCRKHDLLLIDWCRCTLAEPGSVEFAAVFSPLQD
ncbi:MAG: hypothetical protein R3285_10190 [Kiloniellales bacterium]|nr:hypothetical protein [Kiloniellales bacterium]